MVPLLADFGKRFSRGTLARGCEAQAVIKPACRRAVPTSDEGQAYQRSRKRWFILEPNAINRSPR